MVITSTLRSSFISLLSMMLWYDPIIVINYSTMHACGVELLMTYVDGVEFALGKLERKSFLIGCSKLLGLDALYTVDGEEVVGRLVGRV